MPLSDTYRNRFENLENLAISHQALSLSRSAKYTSRASVANSTAESSRGELGRFQFKRCKLAAGGVRIELATEARARGSDTASRRRAEFRVARVARFSLSALVAAQPCAAGSIIQTSRAQRPRLGGSPRANCFREVYRRAARTSIPDRGPAAEVCRTKWSAPADARSGSKSRRRNVLGCRGWVETSCEVVLKIS